MRAGEADQLLLTRFNVQLAAGVGHRGIDPGWLTDRLEVFERVCAPSVAAQFGGPRPWLIFVDAATPVSALARIEAATAGAGVLLAVDGLLPVADLRSRVAAVLAAPNSRRTLITTRLDNDDALAPGHLDAVLAAARPPAAGRREFLNPTRGWQLAGGRAYAVRDRSGPFLSLVEARTGADPLTAFGVPHRRARDAAPVRQLDGGPWWVQVLHGRNLVNAADGVRVDAGELAAALPHLGLAPDQRDLRFRGDQARTAVATLARTSARTLARASTGAAAAAASAVRRRR